MALSLQEKELFRSCFHKQALVKNLFDGISDAQLIYQKIIDIGRSSPPFPKEQMIPENLVSGCQSIMYLHAFFEDGCMHYLAGSEALISSGLAALLIQTYDGEPPETVLKCPPLFIEELGISSSLSPSRSNGLSSLYLRMKQEALKFLLIKK